MEMDRRRFMITGAATTLGAWIAPSVVKLDQAFGATGSPPQQANCTTSALDISVVANGTLLNGTAGPLNTCTVSGSKSLVNLAVGTTPIGTIQVDSVTCSSNPCCAEVKIASLTLTFGGQTLSATGIDEKACCVNGQTTFTSSIASVTINGTTYNVVTTETTVLNTTAASVVLNRNAGNGTVQGIYITLNALGESATVIVGQAQATCS